MAGTLHEIVPVSTRRALLVALCSDPRCRRRRLAVHPARAATSSPPPVDPPTLKAASPPWVPCSRGVTSTSAPGPPGKSTTIHVEVGDHGQGRPAAGGNRSLHATGQTRCRAFLHRKPQGAASGATRATRPRPAEIPAPATPHGRRRHPRRRRADRAGRTARHPGAHRHVPGADPPGRGQPAQRSGRARLHAGSMRPCPAPWSHWMPARARPSTPSSRRR